jgi:NAD(P)-dependent dehydrogenase (short-subunit alcohol dehydrogenase family)
MKHSEFNYIPDLTGKVIFITGGMYLHISQRRVVKRDTNIIQGTSGLGRRAATVFAQRRPSHIYISGRNAIKANDVINELKQIAPDVNVSFVEMDLSSLSTIDEAAKAFTTQANRLDILLCNAGIMACPPALSTDGYEIQFATNHLGHALLIKHLLPTILHTSEKYGDARVVSLTSTGFTVAPKNEGIIFSDLRTTQDYGIGAKWTRYGQSKLAIVMYMVELARRYHALSTASVHPGVIATDLVTSLNWLDRSIVYLTNLNKMVTPEEGVMNGIWACTTPRKSMESGYFYEPVGELGMHTKWSRDTVLAGKLWDWTDEALKEYRI